MKLHYSGRNANVVRFRPHLGVKVRPKHNLQERGETEKDDNGAVQ